MAKFLLISDSHFSAYAGPSREDAANQRLLDIVAAHDLALQSAIEHKVDAIIHCGDFFHDRKAVKNEALHRAGEWLDRVHDSRIPLHMLVGNHDLSSGGSRTASVRALSGRAKTYDAATVVEIAGTKVGFLPYTDEAAFVATTATSLAKQGAIALIAHVGIGDPKFSDIVPTDYEVPGHINVGDLRPDLFAQVFLGHYHNPQDLLPNLRYIGSPIQLSLKEAGQNKRWLIWDTAKGVIEVLNTVSPQFRIVATAQEAELAPATDFVTVRPQTKEDEAAALEIARTRNVRVDRLPVAASAVRLDSALPDAELVKVYAKTAGSSFQDQHALSSLGLEILHG